MDDTLKSPAMKPPPTFSPVTLLTPPRVEFGASCLEHALTGIAAGKQQALIVTTAAVHAHAERAQVALAATGAKAAVFVEPPAEPTVSSCEELLRRARTVGPDLVVGLGGGSVLDAAKLVAALAPTADRISPFFGSGRLPARRVSLVCVPTTAGTGSEASPNALLFDETSQTKKAVIGPSLVPDAAVLDPELTVSLPAALTGLTGIDALSHCLEAYASLAAHPLVDVYALEGVRLIARHLAAAVADGGDLSARSAVMLGSFYGGLCLGPVNTNGVHALAYPLAGEHHLPHALSIALMLPHVVAFNCEALPERHAALARALGAPGDNDDITTARQLPDRLRGLLRACAIPQGLVAHGIARDALPRLAEAGLQVTRLLKANPRPVTLAAALHIYEAAF